MQADSTKAPSTGAATTADASSDPAELTKYVSWIAEGILAAVCACMTVALVVALVIKQPLAQFAGARSVDANGM